MNELNSDCMIKLYTLASLIALALSPLAAKDEDNVQDSKKHLYWKTQYAGNMGLVSVGKGREHGNIFSMDLNYGFLPKFINGARVHTFALRTALLVKRFSAGGIQPSLHLGASINYGIAENTFLRYPEYYPEGYYLPNALHLCPYARIGLGFPLKNKKMEKISLFSEFGTVDYQIYNVIRDKDVRFNEIWNLSFGLAFHYSR